MNHGASWVDPVSNYAVISGIDFSRHMPEILEHKYPQSLITLYLHEITHHWCFDSPVGTVLAMIKYRALRKAILAEGPVGEHLLSDLRPYETAMSLLRPLAEGLALFAEFDARPGSSPIISIPMSCVWLLFDPPRDGTENLSFLGNILYNKRILSEFISRKSHLLVQPMTYSGGGYLPGYMTVKALWSTKRRGSKIFLDTDLFLNYFRNFIYCDYGLISILLSDNIDDIENDLSQYISERINTFLFSFDRFEPAVREFEEHCLNPRSDDYQGPDTESLVQVPGLLTNHDNCMQGIERATRLIREIETTEGIDERDRQLRIAHQWMLAERKMACLTTLDAYTKILENKRVMAYYHGGMIAFPVMFDDLESTEGPGSIGLYLFPETGRQYVIGALGDRMVGAISLSNKPDDIPESFRNFKKTQ